MRQPLRRLPAALAVASVLAITAPAPLAAAFAESDDDLVAIELPETDVVTPVDDVADIAAEIVEATEADAPEEAAVAVGAELAPDTTGGRIVDTAGDPLDVRVRVFAAGDIQRAIAIVPVEADGSFALGGLAFGSYRLRIETTGLDPLGQWWGGTQNPYGSPAIVVDGTTRDLGTQVFTAESQVVTHGDIVGRLFDPDGDPFLEGAKIEVFLAGSVLPTHTVATDGLGRWTAHNLPVGVYHVLATPVAGAGVLPTWYPLERERANSTAITLDRVIHQSGTLGLLPDPDAGSYDGGTVSAGNGDPIEAARVTLDAGATVYTRFTDATGRFTFPAALPDGDYTVHVSAPAFVSEWWQDAADAVSSSTVRVESGRTATVLDIRLTRYASLGGVVTGPSDELLDGARVFLLRSPQLLGSEIVEHVLTDASGRYRFDAVVDGAYYLYFGSPAGAGLQGEWWRDTTDAALAEPVVIALGEGGGRGFDAQLGSRPRDETPECEATPFQPADVECEDPDRPGRDRPDRDRPRGDDELPTLAHTGADAGLVAMIGALLLGAGAVGLAAARIRRRA